MIVHFKIVANVIGRNDEEQLRPSIFVDIHRHHSCFGLEENGLSVETGHFDVYWRKVFNSEETHDVAVDDCLRLGRVLIIDPIDIVKQEDFNPLTIFQNRE